VKPKTKPTSEFGMKIPLLCPGHFTRRDGQHGAPTLADEKNDQIPARCRLTVCDIQMLTLRAALKTA
jgi:hypothetical protein